MLIRIWEDKYRVVFIIFKKIHIQAKYNHHADISFIFFFNAYISL